MFPEGPTPPEPTKKRAIFPVSSEIVASAVRGIVENPRDRLNHGADFLGTSHRDLNHSLLDMHASLMGQSANRADSFFNGAVLAFDIIKQSADANDLPIPPVTVRGFRTQIELQESAMLDAGITDPMEYAKQQQKKIGETDPAMAEAIDKIVEVNKDLIKGDNDATRYGAVVTYLAMQSSVEAEQLRKQVHGDEYPPEQ